MISRVLVNSGAVDFYSVYALYVQLISCPHHAFSHSIAFSASHAYSPVRNRSLGTDAPEDDAGAIEVVPEDVTEADQQQSEGKQLSILTPANLFW